VKDLADLQLIPGSAAGDPACPARAVYDAGRAEKFLDLVRSGPKAPLVKKWRTTGLRRSLYQHLDADCNDPKFRQVVEGDFPLTAKDREDSARRNPGAPDWAIRARKYNPKHDQELTHYKYGSLLKCGGWAKNSLLHQANKPEAFKRALTTSASEDLCHTAGSRSKVLSLVAAVRTELGCPTARTGSSAPGGKATQPAAGGRK
jgi:hypothetical protein